MALYDEDNGVWRTIGGRRVFIKKGQSLSDAMKESGKFKKKDDDDKNPPSTSAVKKDNKEDYIAFDKKMKENIDRVNKEYDEELTKARELGDDKLETQAREKRQTELKKYQDMKNENLENYKRARSGNDVSSELKEKLEELRKDRAGYVSNLENNKDLTDAEKLEKVNAELDSIKKDKERIAKIENDALEYQREKHGEKAYQDAKKEFEKGDDTFRKATNETMNENIRTKASKKSTFKDDLPKHTEIKTQGTSNRKEVSENIQAYILDFYSPDFTGDENLSASQAFIEQMEYMHEPTMWKAGERLAEGGSYDVYTDDMRKFLDDLKINPKGKDFDDDKVFQTYKSLIGRESAKLYDRLQKNEYNKYKQSHPLTKMTLQEFIESRKK